MNGFQCNKYSLIDPTLFHMSIKVIIKNVITEKGKDITINDRICSNCFKFLDSTCKCLFIQDLWPSLPFKI